jgi:hypothetical protein
VRRAESCCRKVLALAIFLAAFFAVRRAEAYPWMIRHDYATCQVCHADPSGAGIMTAYGRAQSEVLLRTHWGKPKDGDEVRGNFAFGAIDLPEWLQLQGDVRNLMMLQTFSGPTPSQKQDILMQADGAASISTGAFRASGSIGYAHGNSALPATMFALGKSDDERIISRQHWVGVAFGKDDAFLLRAGRMNVPFGLRVIEHELLTRQATRTDINAAQQDGVALAWNADGWRAEVMAIAGNLQVHPDALRDRGGAGYVERAFSQRVAIGLSAFVTHSEQDRDTSLPTFRHSYGAFGRWAIVKPVVVLVESDLVFASPRGGTSTTGSTGFAQVDVEPVQGIHVAGTGEYLTKDFGVPPTYGGWLSAFWFFLPHLDCRADFVVESMPKVGQVYSYLAQLHGFL